MLEIDADSGKLIRKWDANMFLVPHGIDHMEKATEN